MAKKIELKLLGSSCVLNPIGTSTYLSFKSAIWLICNLSSCVGYSPTQCIMLKDLFLFLKKLTTSSIVSRSCPAVEKIISLLTFTILSNSGQSAQEQLAILTISTDNFSALSTEFSSKGVVIIFIPYDLAQSNILINSSSLNSVSENLLTYLISILSLKCGCINVGISLN